MDITTFPSNSDIDFLTQQINKETPEFGAAYPFGVFIKDNTGRMIAGANGSIIYGAIYTDQLWVDPQYRYQGIATQLMTQIHDFGKKQECRMATVSTMSFQGAQPFYEKLGYEVDFVRPGYLANSSVIYLKKRLFI